MSKSLVMFMFCFFISIPCHAVNISLTVKEALPSGVSGLNRTEEIATGGIPLAEDSGITSISQLGLSGVSSGQFRALGHWPNGNIKWVLVDFPLTLSADQISTAVSLVDGSGNFGGSNMATDNGTTITVATGAATFTIKKANFNIFDVVSVGATEIVSTGNSGKLSMIGKDDTVYTSANDSSSTAVIEENGPVRVVVKATGAFKSSGGTRHMDYTLRMSFYKDKAAVKGIVELRNASKTNAYLTRDFKSVEAIVPISIGATKTVSYGKNANGTLSVLSGTLASEDTSYLFQGYFHTPQYFSQYDYVTQGYFWQPPLPGSGSDVYTYDTNYVGMKTVNGTTTLNAFGTSTDRATGFASLKDSSNVGVTLDYFRLEGYWPGGFEFKGTGSTSIELYSKQNPYNATNPIKLGFRQHNTREIMWDFFTDGGNDALTYYRLEYPLLVQTSLAYIESTRAVAGQGEFVSATEQATFYTDLNRMTGNTYESLANPSTKVVFRGYPSGESGGGWLQNSGTLNDAVNYIRAGNGGTYLNLRSFAILMSDCAIARADDFEGTESFSIDAEGQTWPKLMQAGGQDGEHRTAVQGLPIYYYLSGEEYIKDAVMDWPETHDFYEVNNSYVLQPNTNNAWLRAVGHALRNTSKAYEFTCEQGACDSALGTRIHNYLDYVLDLIAPNNPPVYGASGVGRDLDRGFFYWELDIPFWSDRSIRENHSLYQSHIYFEALYQAYRVLTSGWTIYDRMLDLEDFMTGLSRYYLDEWLEALPVTGLTAAQDDLQNTPYNFLYAQHYDYALDEASPYDSIGMYSGLSGGLAVYSMSRASIWAYQHTGNTTYLNKGANLVWEQTGFAGDNARNPSELQDQAMMHTWYNHSSLPTWKTLNISVQDNGGGSYTLSWTVPVGATQYQIKHSNEEIVDWLGFNQYTRTYDYDPATYTPFFAATNITNPSVGTAGETQSITLTDLGTGRHFSAKYLSSNSSNSRAVLGSGGRTHIIGSGTTLKLQ